MEFCKHQIQFPADIKNGATVCGAYHSSKRPDGLEWGHFPTCCDDKCPLKHPELLDVGYFYRGHYLVERAILEGGA